MDDRLKQLLAKGREHYDKREFDDAEPYLTEAAEALPDFADIQNMLGVIFHNQDRLERSQAAFERALKLNPRYTEAALNLAVLYADIGKVDESVELHAGALAAAVSGDEKVDQYALGKIANMHADVADAYEEIGMFENAARQYRQALQVCPDFADLRTRLGNVLREMGDFAGAEAEYRQARQSRPTYVPARVYLGVALFAQGKKEEAIAEWEGAIGLDPDNRLATTSLRMVRGESSEPE